MKHLSCLWFSAVLIFGAMPQARAGMFFPGLLSFIYSPQNMNVDAATPPTTFDLFVLVVGTGPFTYQWQKNGVNYGSATTSSSDTVSLFLPTTGTSSGKYRCVVKDRFTTAISDTATVKVWTSPGAVLYTPKMLCSRHRKKSVCLIG